jgi:hypothetical protein
LDAEQRQVGLDRAGVLIDRSAAAIGKRYPDAVPELMAELIGEAREALRAADAG